MPSSLEIVKRFFPDVERVKDASKGLTVKVTPHDVEAGARRKHQECAVARACKRVLKLDGVVVSVGTVYLVKDEQAVRYRVPHHLSRELVAFDRGGRFEPGEYELRKPEKIAPRGSGTRHKGNPRAGKQGRPPHDRQRARLAAVGVSGADVPESGP